MMDLYQMLGVKKDATTTAIRKAYRRKAKKAHPDTGGSAEEFAALKKAHDILTDDERRTRYDANGDTTDTTPDNSMSQVIQILAQAMENVVTQIDNHMGEPTEFDIVSDMKILVGGQLDTLEQRIKSFERSIEKAKKLLGRFGTEKGQNYLEGIVQGKISAMQTNVRLMSEQSAPVKKALEILKISSFKSDYGGAKSNHQYGGKAPSAYHITDLMSNIMSGGS